MISRKEQISYWLLWVLTALFSIFLLIELTFVYLERFGAFNNLPDKGIENRQYDQPQASGNNTRFVTSSAGEHDDGSNNGDPQKQADNYAVTTSVLNQFIKEKRDLNAQEGMWLAANYMVVLTVIQVIVGAITLIFLLWTLHETRRTANAARDTVRAAELSEKAKIVVKVAKHGFENSKNLSADSPQQSEVIRFELINAGRGIGITQTIRGGGKNTLSEQEFNVLQGDWFDEDSSFQAILLPEEGLRKKGPEYSIVLPPEHAPANRPGELLYFAWVEIDYSDGFNRVWRARMTFRQTDTSNALNKNRGEIGFGPLSYSELQIGG